LLVCSRDVLATYACIFPSYFKRLGQLAKLATSYMNTERQRQQTEYRRQRAEDERQDTEKQRNADEHKRRMAEKQREVGEQLRGIERTGERLVVKYSTRALLTRIAEFEEQLSQVAARLESIEHWLSNQWC
jgi:hypothetical protein